VAVGQGADPHLSVRVLGQTGGEATHTLGTAETPWHTHALRTAATAQDAVNSPSGTVVLGAASGTQAGGSFPVPLYVSDPNPAQALAPQAVGAVGGQPHTNMMPSSALYYCIALEGQFPTQD
jgi:microcystin-dependent protein